MDTREKRSCFIPLPLSFLHLSPSRIFADLGQIGGISIRYEGKTGVPFKIENQSGGESKYPRLEVKSGWVGGGVWTVRSVYRTVR